MVGCGLLRYNFTQAETCDNVRVQSATEWTASVHTLHMPQPVITFMFKVLGTGLLRYILYTCPKPVITFVFEVLYNGLLLRQVDFSLSFMFEITRAGCYVMSRVSSSYISVHMGHSRLRHVHIWFSKSNGKNKKKRKSCAKSSEVRDAWNVSSSLLQIA